jgi:hypothetical protein
LALRRSDAVTLRGVALRIRKKSATQLSRKHAKAVRALHLAAHPRTLHQCSNRPGCAVMGTCFKAARSLQLPDGACADTVEHVARVKSRSQPLPSTDKKIATFIPLDSAVLFNRSVRVRFSPALQRAPLLRVRLAPAEARSRRRPRALAGAARCRQDRLGVVRDARVAAAAAARRAGRRARWKRPAPRGLLGG